MFSLRNLFGRVTTTETSPVTKMVNVNERVVQIIDPDGQILATCDPNRILCAEGVVVSNGSKGGWFKGVLNLEDGTYTLRHGDRVTDILVQNGVVVGVI